MKSLFLRLFVIFCVTCALAPGVAAQEPTPETDSASTESQADELSRRATDPTASPLTFSLIGVLTADFYDLADGSSIDGTATDLRFQPVIPFKAWGVPNILRMTLPYKIHGEGTEGLGDIALFDLLVFQQSWGRLGVGFVGTFSSRFDESSSAAVGPAAGFMVPLSKKLQVGLFNQNLFSGDVALSQLQPIAAYQLGDGWSLSLGDLQFVYDWKGGDLLSIPIGVQLGKVLPLWGQPMRFAINPQYNLNDTPGSARLSMLLTVSLIVPGG